MMSCLDRRAILPMLLGAAALVPIPLDGQITYLAVVSDGAAHLFRAAYRNGHLTTIDTSPSGLRRGALLQGLSVRGQLVRVRIDSINPDYEPPEAEFHVTVHGTLPPDPSALLYDSVTQLQVLVPELRTDSAARAAFYRRYTDVNRRWLQAYGAYGSPRAVLMWLGTKSPHYIRPESLALDTAVDRIIHHAADSLWRRALADLPKEDQQLNYRFGCSEALSVPQLPGIIFVWRQAISSAEDPRGSFFFIINSRGHAFLAATFGHPEWSPTSDIVQTRPYLFFKIGDDPRVFLLAERRRAWEDYSGGWAILDASNGRVVAPSN